MPCRPVSRGRGVAGVVGGRPWHVRGWQGIRDGAWRGVAWCAVVGDGVVIGGGGSGSDAVRTGESRGGGEVRSGGAWYDGVPNPDRNASRRSTLYIHVLMSLLLQLNVQIGVFVPGNRLYQVYHDSVPLKLLPLSVSTSKCEDWVDKSPSSDMEVVGMDDPPLMSGFHIRL